MGAWGIGPFDNDPAADLIAGLMKPINTVVERKSVASARFSYSEARAAAQFILAAHGTDILGGPDLPTVLKALMRMRGDVEWLSGWRDPKAAAKALDREIAAVVDKISTCKGCRSHRNDSLAEFLAWVRPPVPAALSSDELAARRSALLAHKRKGRVTIYKRPKKIGGKKRRSS